MYDTRDANPVEAIEIEPALFVDLDGTLVRTDMLWESFASSLRLAPMDAVKGVGRLREGRAQMKRALAAASRIDATKLPYRADFVEWLKAEAARGRRIYLATASDSVLAQEVASHLGLFEDVIASDGSNNRKGMAKLEAIKALVGDEPFDYCGNGPEDVAIFAASRQAIVVGASGSVLRAAQELGNVQRVFPEPSQWSPWLRELRPHQWLKNLLVFVPLITSFKFAQSEALLSTLTAFVAFCVVASAGYFFNDVLDVQTDRRHPRKRLRPIASGDIPIPAAFAASGLMLAMALILSLTVNLSTAAWLLVYLVLTLSYSLRVKRVAVFDLGMLAALYSVRVVTGGAAADAKVSFWLLAFSAFLFFSLAVLKRCGELISRRDRGEMTAEGRAYDVNDLPVLIPIGVGASVASVLVFALFVESPEVAQRYGEPDWLWLTLSALLFWLCRLWLITNRGQMDDDPLVYAARDKTSRFLLVAMIAGMAAAALLR